MFRAIWNAIVRGKRRNNEPSWCRNRALDVWMFPDYDGYAQLGYSGTVIYTACDDGVSIPEGAVRLKKGQLAHLGLIDLEQEGPSSAFRRVTGRILARKQ